MSFNKPEPTGNRYTALHLCNALLLFGLWLFAVVGYGHLPDRIPAHFGVSGVTSWTARDSGFWFLLPVLASFETGLMYVLSRLTDNGPQGLNVPHRKRLLALPREGQRFAMEPTRPFMFAMAAWLLLLMTMIQVQIFLAARSGAGAQAGSLLPLVLGFAALPLLGVYWLHRAVRLRIEDWESRTAP